MDTLKNILLVEDSDDDVFFVKRAFKSAGILNPVKVCINGEEAVDYLKGCTTLTKPAFMLLDLKTPRKNGFEVLEWLRTDSPVPDLIVVILTSSILPADLKRAYMLGTNAYLSKVTEKETLHHMATLLKQFWLDLNQAP